MRIRRDGDGIMEMKSGGGDEEGLWRQGWREIRRSYGDENGKEMMMDYGDEDGGRWGWNYRDENGWRR